MNALTETVQIEQTTYVLKSQVSWYEQQIISSTEFKLLVDGKTISQADDIASLPEVEVRLTSEQAMLNRLSFRLLDDRGQLWKPSEVKKIPPAHVPILLARIKQLEEVQVEEGKRLQAEHPFTTNSNG